MEPKFVIVKSLFGKFHPTERLYAIPIQQLMPDHELVAGEKVNIIVNRSFNVETTVIQLLDSLPSPNIVVLHRDEYKKERELPNFSTQNFLAVYVRSR